MKTGLGKSNRVIALSLRSFLLEVQKNAIDGGARGVLGDDDNLAISLQESKPVDLRKTGKNDVRKEHSRRVHDRDKTNRRNI